MRSTPLNDSPASRTRSGAIDALRVLGIAAVVVGHVWENSVTERVFYPWHVPLFFFLTGYLWTAGRPFMLEARKRWRTLGRPYLFWLVVLLCVWVGVNFVQQDLEVGDVARPVYGGFFATRPFSAFWFVTALFFAALVYRALERTHPAAKWLAILVGLGTTYVAGDLVARLPLSAGMALPCLAFIAAGALFRRLEPRITAPVLVALVLLLASGVLVWSGASAPLHIKEGDLGTPVLSVLVAVGICSALLILTKRAFEWVPTVVHRGATAMAKAGFVVVLVHAVPLLILGTTSAGGVLDLVIALMGSWLLGLVILRTRLSPWAAGIANPSTLVRHGQSATTRAQKDSSQPRPGCAK